jgi:type IV pilus assembly protein PilC
LIVTVLLLIYVVPAFESSFSSFGASLPLPTRMIIDGSGALRSFGLPLLLVVTLVMTLVHRLWQQRPAWQLETDRLLLRLPVFGSLLQRVALARWSRTMASLYGAGITMLDALEPAGQSTDNRLYQSASQSVKQSISRGDSLSSSLMRHPLFSPLLIQMVHIGEESGTLDAMMNKVADIYEREVDDTVAMLGSLMEPLLMVVLGGLIGGLVIAMYLPIFQLGSVL